MKNVSAAAIEWLAANGPLGVYRADLLDITLFNGEHLRAVCDGMADLAWSGNTYYATANGTWSRGVITSEAGSEMKANECALTAVAQDGALFPGTSVALSESFVGAAWDAAPILITTVYMPMGAWGNVQATMVAWAGMVSNCSRTGRSKAVLTCQDWLYLCNLQVPLRIVQPSCFSTFGDARCTFSLAAIALANTVAVGSTPVQIIPATAWPANDSRGNSISALYSGDGYFANGKITWTSGNNKGFTSHVQSQDSNGTLVLSAPPPFPVATADGFTAYAGCSKQLSDCTGRWANEANFSGMPFIGTAENAF